VKRTRRAAGEIFPLSAAGTGDVGVIIKVGSESDLESLSRTELERRLLEMGFVEGARVKVLHEGFIGRDPIAVELDDMRVALRRREAADVMVQSLHEND
jgi:ferrous iron transport protein A